MRNDVALGHHLAAAAVCAIVALFVAVLLARIVIRHYMRPAARTEKQSQVVGAPRPRTLEQHAPVKKAFEPEIGSSTSTVELDLEEGLRRLAVVGNDLALDAVTLYKSFDRGNSIQMETIWE